ncbi:MAG: hypothetical protein RLN89_03020 [Parvibaculum sp.]
MAHWHLTNMKRELLLGPKTNLMLNKMVPSFALGKGGVEILAAEISKP